MTLNLDDVSVSYQGLLAVRNCSISMQPGEFTALLGANGAGKSTLLGVAARLVRQRSGRVSLDGRSVDRWRPDRAARAGIALVPEGRRLLPTLSVEENLRIGAARLRRSEERGALHRVLDVVPLLSARLRLPAARLSGGEQQVLAIGRALIGQPRFLLVDELSLGLAPVVTRELHELLRRLCDDTGVAVLAVEQRADIVLDVADSAVVLRRGSVAHRGSAAELRNRPELLQAAYLEGAA